MDTIMETGGTVMTAETESTTITATILMTLYDLIAAVQNVVASDDDARVVASVVGLLRAGRVTWRGDDAAFIEWTRECHLVQPVSTGSSVSQD